MSTVRLNGISEKLGPVTTSDEFLTWEIPDEDSSKRMRNLLRTMSIGSVALDRDKYAGIGFGEGATASFVEQVDFSYGREDSAHQVRFGQLLLNGNGVHEKPEFIALKPFDDRQSLYREWAAHDYLNSLFDRQIGYINLGVHNDTEGRESIISMYDHGVTSLDSSFWADDDAPAAALRPGILRAVMLPWAWKV